MASISRGTAVEIDTVEDYSIGNISWAAVLAGAVAIVVVTLVMMAFGTGLGFAAVSPWPNSGLSGRSLTVMAAVWLVIVQWLSALMGGYLSGRLRSRWEGVQGREVYFADSAHGFLAWSIATILGFLLVGATAAHMISNAENIAASATQEQTASATGGGTGAGMEHNALNPMSYYVDSLFRSEHPDATMPGVDVRGESERILLSGLKNGNVSNTDQDYLTRLVEARTGLPPADAQRRVTDVLTRAKGDEAKMRQVADDARRATASFSIYAFLSMLVGAFIASVAAALGGRHRDEGWSMMQRP